MERDPSPIWLSILLDAPPGAAGLERSLEALNRIQAGGWEALLAARDQGAWQAAQGAIARAPGEWRLLPPPPTSPAVALPQALAQARGRVVLFITAGAAVPGHLPGLLRERFESGELVGLGLALQPPSGGGQWAGVAGLEMLAQQESLPLPLHGCAAFDRQALLQAGGLEPLPGLEALELWLRLESRGLALAWEEDAYLVLEQPRTLGALLARAMGEGRAMFARRRLLRGLGRRAGRGRENLQALLALAAPCLLVGLWPQAPDRAVTLALLALLLLYPLNRPFLGQVAEYRPGAVGRAMLYCLLRPFAWLGGLGSAALARLAGGHLLG